MRSLVLLVLAGCNGNSISLNERDLSDLGPDIAGLPCSTTCTTGCCDSAGVCRSGLDSNACGAWGATCAACAGSQCLAIGSGHGGNCFAPDGGTCSTFTCIDGCCQGGTCILATSEKACGTFGEVCSICAPNETCKSGCFRVQPSCGPDNCPGCCDGDKCYPGTNFAACGAGGQACEDCHGKAPCIATGTGGRCGGAPCDCPSGCCLEGQCMTGDTDAVCGGENRYCDDCTLIGNTCAALAPMEHRCLNLAGTCYASCGGCCYGDVCAVGDQDIACGVKGAACSNCAFMGKKCVSGACE
jgi:hypothetical protein